MSLSHDQIKAMALQLAAAMPPVECACFGELQAKMNRTESRRIGVVKMPAHRPGAGRQAFSWADCIWRPGRTP